MNIGPYLFHRKPEQWKTKNNTKTKQCEGSLQNSEFRLTLDFAVGPVLWRLEPWQLLQFTLFFPGLFGIYGVLTGLPTSTNRRCHNSARNSSDVFPRKKY